MKSDKSAASIVLVSLALLMILLVFGGSGVRGSDQYWYVADVQSLIDGDTSYTTNMFFPGKLLREGDSPTPNYYMHNGYAIHAAAFLGRWVGAYKGWLLLNVCLHVISALLVLKCLNNILRPVESAWVTAVYILAPIAIWQTVNPLLEQSYAFVTALFVYGYFNIRESSGAIALGLAVCLGVVSHPIFLLPSLSIIIVYAWNYYKRQEKINVIGFCLVSSVFFLSMIFLKDTLPSSFQPNLAAIITSSVPGVSNMFWHYSIEQHAISVELMTAKIVTAIDRHIFSLKFSPFYIFTNISCLLILWMLVFRIRKLYWIVLPACIFVGLYLSMILLQQNHPRYQQIIAPVVFLSIGAFLAEYKINVSSLLKGMLVLGVVLVNLYVLDVARKESFVEQNDLTRIKNELGMIDDIDRIASFDVMPHNPVSYLLQPKPLLAIRTDMLSEGHIIEALLRFSPDHLISTHPLERNIYGLRILPEADIRDTIFGNLYVYSIEE